jgi:SNF2 family DNA or RNA helicase
MSDEDLKFDEGMVSKKHKLVALGKLSQVTSGFMYISEKNDRICDGCPQLGHCVETDTKPYTKACAVVQVAPPTKTIRTAENPKLDMLEELLDSILNGAPDNKVIIWAKALEELKMIEELLRREKIKFVRIKDDAREDSKPFENDPDVRVMIANISVGIGFTANAANYMIYYSLSFDLGHYLQSIDRNYRIGQGRQVTVYRLLARGTIDERAVDAIERKVDISEALLNNMDCMRCDRVHDCVMLGIRQYDPGCKYKKTASAISLKTKKGKRHDIQGDGSSDDADGTFGN